MTNEEYRFLPTVTRRRLSPEEQVSTRVQLLSRTIQALTDSLQTIPPGKLVCIELQPHVQETNTSCGIANAVAISKGIARAKHIITPSCPTEQRAIIEARRRGIYGGVGGVGIKLPDDADVNKFLQEVFGIVTIGFPDLDPDANARLMVEAILNGNLVLMCFPLVNEARTKMSSAGHFATIFGVDIKSGNDLRWLVMDPMKAEIQEYTNYHMAQTLAGTLYEPQFDSIQTTLSQIDVRNSMLVKK